MGAALRRRDTVIKFNDPDVGTKLAAAAGAVYNPAAQANIALTHEGNVLGGVVYDNYNGHSIGMHVAAFAPDWVTKDMLWVCFHYPFVQLGCKKLFGLVPETKVKALEFNRKIGFKEICTVPDVFADGGMVVMTMAKEDCRWLRIKPSARLTEGSNGREI